MQTGGILRIASRISVQIEEEGNLHGYAAASAKSVIRAITGIASLGVHVDGVIPIRYGIRYFPADLGHDGGSGASVRCSREVHQVTVMSHQRSDLAVGAGVFVRRLGIVGVAEPGVPGVETGDLVPDKIGVAPTRSPEDSLAHG